MSLKSLLVSVLLSFFFLFNSVSVFPAEDEAQDPGRFSTGVTGSISGDDQWNHTSMLEYRKAQNLFLAIAEKPRDRGFVESALDGLPFGLDDILAKRLLREEEGLYYLDFNFLTQRDQKKIYDVSEKYAISLTRAFEDRWDEFDTIFQENDQPGITKQYLAYAIIGLMALDWDGLTLTRQMGFRPEQPTHVEGDERYTPWAKENGDLFTVKELYWGSHNENGLDGRFNLTSFGDHFSLPRRGMPDILWGSAMPLKGAEGDLRILNHKTSYYGLRALYRDYAELLFAVKTAPLSADEVATRMGWNGEETEAHLGYLVEIQAIGKTEGGYLATIPVIEKSDAGMVQRARALAWDIMKQWLEENHSKLKAELSDLSAVRQGLPFGVMFTEIWHFVFGITNRGLARAGHFTNPYGEGRRYKGFLQILWESDVYEDFSAN